MADGTLHANDRHPAPRKSRPRIEIALVNNMPDSALAATERQFEGLMKQAVNGEFDVCLRLYSLGGIPRSDKARAMLLERYDSFDVLKKVGADALIVTGNEPRSVDLRREPYWNELTKLIDWARENTLSSIWSCLAAHAAVLHLDNVERQPLLTKCTGVFAFDRTAESSLSTGLPDQVHIPHSRRNALLAEHLEAKGYQILTRSPRAGVDLFTRQEQSLLVFLQGHPEYDIDSLLREYCRDVGRFLRGEQADYPKQPQGYFDAETEKAFDALAERVGSLREAQVLTKCGDISRVAKLNQSWRPHAVTLYRNWLGAIAAAKAETAPALLRQRH